MICDNTKHRLLFLALFCTAPSASIRWSEFRDKGCSEMGVRIYSAQLLGIPLGQSWEATCAQTPAKVSGVDFESPTRCLTTVTGIFGEFDISVLQMHEMELAMS